MTVREQDEIYESLRERLQDQISTLTNFTTESFNYVWTQAFAEELREREMQLTVARLASWIDYSGGPLTQEDLNDLDLDNVTPEELNQYVEDDHLDELVKIVGVERDGGSEAIGEATFTTQNASTTIDNETEVGTQPDSSGDYFSYETTEEVISPSGVTTIDAPIEAVDVGSEYNAGAGAVSYLPDPPSGVLQVTNAEVVDGGEDAETNDELRERAKDAVFRSSGGGTVQGIIGYIEDNTGASEVSVVEFPDGDSIRDYPHGHVIVSGGENNEVLQAIDDSRPVSVEHVLRRPSVVSLNTQFSITGENITTNSVESAVETFLDDLDLGENLYEDRLIFTIMGASEGVNNISSIDYSVNNEAFFYDPNIDIYNMQLGEEMLDDGVSEITGDLDGDGHTFVEDTNYEEIDDDGDSSDDSIDWSIGISSSTDNISYSSGQTEYEINQNIVHDGITNVENTTTSTTLTDGTDYETADTDDDSLHDGIRFLNTQNDGDTIEVTYDEGDVPDVLADQSQQETYSVGTERYIIDNAMVNDGIGEVTGTLNGSSNTFTEGVDYEEWDSDGDSQPEGIDWSIGGENPDNNTEFTVTYDAGTQFLVDYDTEEGDIIIDEDERIDAGNITATEV